MTAAASSARDGLPSVPTPDEAVWRTYLVRHAETEWSLNGRHTGMTDVPLTENGRRIARELESLLAPSNFALVLSSPLQRARQTSVLAGGHVLRVLAARWLGLPVSDGSRFLLDTATLSVLSHYRSIPAIKQWNSRVPDPDNTRAVA